MTPNYYSTKPLDYDTHRHNAVLFSRSVRRARRWFEMAPACRQLTMAHHRYLGGLPRPCGARIASLACWGPRVVPVITPEPVPNMTVLALSTVLIALMANNSCLRTHNIYRPKPAHKTVASGSTPCNGNRQDPDSQHSRVRRWLANAWRVICGQ